LYAAKEDKGMIYQDYANSLPLADIIKAAEVATLNPTQKQLKKYMQSEWAAIRFWGAMGCLILKERGVDLKTTTHKELKHLLNDSSSDIRVVAAEVLCNTKSKAMAQTTIENLLSSQNPYVVLRALNTLEATSITSFRIAEEIKKISRRDGQGKFRYAIRKAEYLILRFNQ
ncbi:MAG: HEAT repeat domain-containing protein, partial [Bacteroidota bacterium]